MTLALYRRYRPESFAAVIGQEHVTEPLQQALRNGRVHHAYLFSGPRGCGKTTSARILARCLNCEQGPTPTPCGICRSCLDLARTGPGSLDVLEIDAASHGGVDDARDLRERAVFAPAASRYKIYIIDEAHMVSPAGFNALLKVVEEPPEHVRFVFATTEPEKVIGTIRSRTHHYPFRLVPPGRLQDYLGEVCVREGVAVDKGVLPLVVRAGRGSVRDSLSVLDQLLAGAGEQGVSYRLATALLGYTDAALLDETLEAFAAGDGAAVFRVVDRVIEAGHDPRRFTEDLLERLRDLLILDAVPDAPSAMFGDVPADQLERMRQQARRFGSAELSLAADLVNTGLTEMRGATAPRLQLELICARVLLPGASDDPRGTAARLDRLERRIGMEGQVTAAATPGTAAASSADALSAAASSAGAALAGAAPADAAPVDEPLQPPRPSALAPAVADGADVTADGASSGGTAEAMARRRSSAERTAEHRDETLREVEQRAGVGPPGEAGLDSQPATAVPATGLDLAAVRTLWPDVVERTSALRRATWTILLESSVLGFENGVLSLGISRANYFHAFKTSGHDEIVRQALIDAVGIDARVEPVLAPGGPGASGAPGTTGGIAPASAPGRSAARPDRGGKGAVARSVPAPLPARLPAPLPAGSAPVPSAPVATSTRPVDDEPSPDDPDLDEGGLSSLELLQRNLGAKVIGEYDASDS